MVSPRSTMLGTETLKLLRLDGPGCQNNDQEKNLCMNIQQTLRQKLMNVYVNVNVYDYDA